MTFRLLLVGLVGVVSGAVLFTNAVEWAGNRLGLGVGAVGTLLAGVSTALPESVIPVVAILRGDEESEEVAIGAIIGAPFMLGTIAMALVGVTAVVYRKHRETGRSLDVHRPTLRRDLAFFLAMLSVGVLLGVGVPAAIRLAGAVLLVAAYVVYVLLTVRRGGEVQGEDELPDLIADPSPKQPATWRIVVQFVGGLALIVGGAHFVVDGLIELAELLGVSALVLALIVAPLGTELPEKLNSFLWVRDGKDSLALGNLTGALVFQSAVPIALGLAFTPWALSGPALVAALLALGGGLVAVWSFQVRSRFSGLAIACWLVLFAAFPAIVWMLG